MPLKPLQHAVRELIQQERSKVEKFKDLYEKCMAILEKLVEQNAFEEFATLKRLLTPYRAIYSYIANLDTYSKELNLQDIQETDTQTDMAIKLANILYANSFLPIYREAIEARLQIDALGSFFDQPSIKTILELLEIKSSDLASLYSQAPLSSERLKDLANALTKQKEQLTDDTLLKIQALFEQLGTMAYDHSNQIKGLEKTVFDKEDTGKKTNVEDALDLYKRYQDSVSTAKTVLDKAERDWMFELGKPEEERNNSVETAYTEAQKKHENAKKYLEATQTAKTNIITKKVEKFSIDKKLKELEPKIKTTVRTIYEQTTTTLPLFERIPTQLESKAYKDLWETSLTPTLTEESSSSEEKVTTPRPRKKSFLGRVSGRIKRTFSTSSKTSDSEEPSEEYSPPSTPSSSSTTPGSPRKISISDSTETLSTTSSSSTSTKTILLATPTKPNNDSKEATSSLDVHFTGTGITTIKTYGGHKKADVKSSDPGEKTTVTTGADINSLQTKLNLSSLLGNRK